MKEFRVNEYLTLKLEDNKTFIYVNNKRFLQCIRLILQIPKLNVSDYDEINSIDEAADVNKTLLNNRIYEDNQPHTITPDQEFLGHCSNIQAWAENQYDTRILHSKISFPLLKELTKAGDPIAKRVFKDEIGKRFMAGYEPVKEYLAAQGYLNFLKDAELDAIGATEYKLAIYKQIPRRTIRDDMIAQLDKLFGKKEEFYTPRPPPPNRREVIKDEERVKDYRRIYL